MSIRYRYPPTLVATRVPVAAPLAALVAALVTAAPASAQTAEPNMPASTAPDALTPTGFGEAVDRAVERVRSATAPFREIDAAVAAGYPRSVARCLDNPPAGGMGYHHQNADLLDDRIEVERPEILVYARDEDGAYRLAGVEYIVPLSAWTKDEPPEVMGRALKRAPSLGIWYLHVWVWRPNPSGLFADWNPDVRCPSARPR